MNILAVIGARGGSKGLPGKNVASLCGKPLLAWSIDAARQSASIARTVVSTDDETIAIVARQHGADVPFLRPAALATDDAPAIAVVRHVVEALARDGYHPDAVMLLQPTSPLRTAGDIDRAAALLLERQADAVVSVCPAKPHPYWMKGIDATGWMRDLLPQPEAFTGRQALPEVYALNGAIYLVRSEVLLTGGWNGPRTAAYVMPLERSIDIDTSLDLAIAEFLLGRRLADAGAGPQ